VPLGIVTTSGVVLEVSIVILISASGAVMEWGV
jgi:hypothetical protein